MARPNFETAEAAGTWMESEVDDPCTDNFRFAFEDDDAAMAKYDARKDSGCCGAFDAEIVVAGRLARIGCNYGH